MSEKKASEHHIYCNYRLAGTPENCKWCRMLLDREKNAEQSSEYSVLQKAT